MSILEAGGEMGFFVPSDSTVIETTSNSGGNKFDAAFARCSVKCPTGACYADSPTLASAQTDCFVHFDCSSDGTITSTTKKVMVQLLDSGGVAYVRLTADGSTTGVYEYSLEHYSGGLWVSVGTFTMSGITLQTIDIHCKSNTASGVLDLYVAGNKRIDGGTVDLSAFAGVKKVRFWGRTVSIGAAMYYSQVIIASDSTIGKKVGTIVMTGNGASTAWTGDYTAIDEVVYSDGDEINSSVSNDIELYTGTAVPSFTGYTIGALGIYTRAKTSGGAAPTQEQLALRSAGANYFSATKVLDVGYGAIGNVWLTDPATSAAFLSTAIASLQYGVKSIA